VETKRFIEMMRARFRHDVVDEYWGPLDPRVRSRVLQLAFGIVNQAEMLERAQEGLGVGLLKSFDGDVPEICPPWPPWPIPPIDGPVPGPWPEPEPIAPEMFGAAIVFAAGYVRNEELANLATEIGEQMVG